MSDVENNNEDGEQEGAEPAEPSPLEQAEAERDRVKDQLLRVAADFDNFRKRTKKDLELTERKAKEEVIRELLPVFDNLERAVSAARETSDVASVVSGIEMVLKLFEDAAGRVGLERFTSVGERFDPSLHDAFQQRESAEHAPGTILAEFQSGYRLGDRLVRPAMVVVSKRPAEPAPEADNG